MMHARLIRLAALSIALGASLAGCSRQKPVLDFEFEKADLFLPDPDGPDVVARQFDCLQRDLEGNCIANRCRESPSSAPDVPYDCRTFAAACIDAGLHWTGTRQEGVCAVAL